MSNNDLTIALIKKLRATTSKREINKIHNSLYEFNKRIIFKIIYNFKWYNNLDTNVKDELIQVGRIALFDAIKNFNCDLNIKFITFAYSYIQGRAKTFIINESKHQKTIIEAKSNLVIKKSDIHSQAISQESKQEIEKIMLKEFGDKWLQFKLQHNLFSHNTTSIYESTFNLNWYENKKIIDFVKNSCKMKNLMYNYVVGKYE